MHIHYDIDSLTSLLINNQRRSEIAECSEKAYNSLSVADAQKSLLFSTSEDLLSFAKKVHTSISLFHFRKRERERCKKTKTKTKLSRRVAYTSIPQRGWDIEGNRISFKTKSSIEEKKKNKTEVPSLKLINQTLTYAKELERIV